jgi:NAD-dependent DNA ligase
MIATNKTKKGVVDKGQRIKEGPCIFPFVSDDETHEKCKDTRKGPICATSVTKTQRLKTFGYCPTPMPIDNSAENREQIHPVQTSQSPQPTQPPQPLIARSIDTFHAKSSPDIRVANTQLTPEAPAQFSPNEQCGMLSASSLHQAAFSHPSQDKMYSKSSLVDTNNVDLHRNDVILRENMLTSSSSRGEFLERTKEKTPVTIIEEKMAPKPARAPSVPVIVKQLRSNGIPILDSYNEEILFSFLEKLNKAYYNATSTKKEYITDDEYDIVKEYLRLRFPDNTRLDNIGAPVDRKKTELPYFMGSMDKIKPDTDALEKWKTQYPGTYMISCKLDGVSGLYSTENGVRKLYTRGNGRVGQDISYFIPYFQLPNDENITIRGEFIIRHELFKTQYSGDFANARNFVAGVMNSKTIDKEKISAIDFVAYEVIEPVLTPSKQMELLEKLHVKKVHHQEETSITNEYLSSLLTNLRSSYLYEIDGLIVTHDAIHPRQDSNPEHAFAFKMFLSDQMAEAHVVDVLWSASKDGYLKPRIRIEPITLSGVTIEYATAFNAAFVETHKLGVGAIVKLIRSGDVIPHIMEVVKPAIEAKMPLQPYEWNSTHVDIVLLDSSSDPVVKQKNIAYFFSTLDVNHVGPGTVQRLVRAGFDTIPKIVEMTAADLQQVDGIQAKSALKIYNSIEATLEKASLPVLAAASNIYGHGFGERKVKLVVKAIPDIFISPIPDTELINQVRAVKGMAEKSAIQFVSKRKEFVRFLDEIHCSHKLSNTKPIRKDPSKNEVQLSEKVAHPLYSAHVLFTGFRDKELMKELEDKYEVHFTSVVNSKTKIVVAKDTSQETSKLKEARKRNIPILTIEEFKSQYLA